MSIIIEYCLSIFSLTTWIFGVGIFATLVVLLNLKLATRLLPNIVGTLLTLGTATLFILINFTESYRDVGDGVGVLLLVITSLIAFTAPVTKPTK